MLVLLAVVLLGLVVVLLVVLDFEEVELLVVVGLVDFEEVLLLELELFGEVLFVSAVDTESAIANMLRVVIMYFITRYRGYKRPPLSHPCLLYTSDAADD